MPNKSLDPGCLVLFSFAIERPHFFFLTLHVHKLLSILLFFFLRFLWSEMPPTVIPHFSSWACSFPICPSIILLIQFQFNAWPYYSWRTDIKVENIKENVGINFNLVLWWKLYTWLDVHEKVTKLMFVQRILGQILLGFLTELKKKSREPQKNVYDCKNVAICCWPIWILYSF